MDKFARDRLLLEVVVSALDDRHDEEDVPHPVRRPADVRAQARARASRAIQQLRQSGIVGVDEIVAAALQVAETVDLRAVSISAIRLELHERVEAAAADANDKVLRAGVEQRRSLLRRRADDRRRAEERSREIEERRGVEQRRVDEQRKADDERRANELARRDAEARAATVARRLEIEQEVVLALQSDFCSTDEHYSHHGELPRDDYLRLRRAHVRSWLRDRDVTITLDDDQIDAIGSVTGDVHVTARAGSGKTMVMVLRAAFLQLHCRVPPEQIMLIAFNRRAIKEIETRLKQLLSPGTRLPVIIGFHALARAVVEHRGRIVIDNKNDRTLSEVVREAVDELAISDPDRVRSTTLAYLTEGCGTDERIVSSRQALDGHWYKSRGEVAIANELFRRGVTFAYEERVKHAPFTYLPDFTIQTPSRESVLVIEFFGREHDPGYDKETARKLEFWQSGKGRSQPFLALYPSDLKKPDQWWSKIQSSLEALGHPIGPRMTDEQVWAKRRDRMLRDFHTSVRSFIGVARRTMLTPADVRARLRRHHALSSAESSFVDVAVDAYSMYLDKLRARNGEDFDGLLSRAIEVIRNGNAVLTHRHDGDRVDLSGVRFLHVDELQDLSPLFSGVIEALKSTADGNLGVFGVGDDWQMINGYAGSDLQLFHAFRDRSATQIHLARNYRSSRPIVATGNDLMTSHGRVASAASEAHGQVIDATGWNGRRDLDSRPGEVDLNALLSLISHALRTRGGSVAVLFRQESTGISRPRSRDFEIEELAQRIATVHPRWVHDVDGRTGESRVQISTVHSFKGMEADSVILVAPESQFPLIHPSWFLTRVLGNSLERVWDEERRLLYVGVTRARKDLYLFTPTGSKLVPTLVGTGTRVIWGEIGTHSAAGPQATARVWPVHGCESLVREAASFAGPDALGRWTLRGPRADLDPGDLDQRLGGLVRNLVIRDDDGSTLFARYHDDDLDEDMMIETTNPF